MTENEIAKRFGLASLEFKSSGITSPLTISQDEALQAIDGGLNAVCTTLDLEPVGLGTCWRASSPWPDAPTLKIIAHDTRRFGEDGNYAPACGTINLFGPPSSLSHEFAHAIDFQLTGTEAPPWSHGETWGQALGNAPTFCANLLPGLERGGRVRLSDVYLATPHETFARAFECMIVDNARSQWPHAPDTSCERTYPQGTERKALSDVIKHKVITQLRTKNAAQP